jgi:hypothetical protein
VEHPEKFEKFGMAPSKVRLGRAWGARFGNPWIQQTNALPLSYNRAISSAFHEALA